MNASVKAFESIWRTADELRFLEELGLHASNGLSRRALLLKYLATAKKRTAWGEVDPERAIQRARDLLRASA